MPKIATVGGMETQQKQKRPAKAVQPQQKQRRPAKAVQPQQFGTLLRSYRDSLGLTQRTLATVLGVDVSTIARVEAGSRKPPRDASFYENLHDVPGLEKEHIEALLATEDAPRLVVPRDKEVATPTKRLPKIEIASAGNLQVTLALSGDTENLADDEITHALRAAKQTTELLLRRLQERATKGEGKSTTKQPKQQLAQPPGTQGEDPAETTSMREPTLADIPHH